MEVSRKSTIRNSCKRRWSEASPLGSEAVCNVQVDAVNRRADTKSKCVPIWSRVYGLSEAYKRLLRRSWSIAAAKNKRELLTLSQVAGGL